MAVIAVLGVKGGIGKTLIAAHLTVELAGRGVRVLALDCDPQKSLLAWSWTKPGGMLAHFVYPVPRTLAKGFVLRLHSHEAGFETVSGYLTAYSARPKSQPRERVVHVILDTPSDSQDAAHQAAAEADVVLLPTGVSPLDLQALEQTLAVARRVREDRGIRGRLDTVEPHTPLPLIALVPNLLQSPASIDTGLLDILRTYGELVLPALQQRTAYAEAARLGQTVREYQPRSPGHEEVLALTCAVERLLP